MKNGTQTQQFASLASKIQERQDEIVRDIVRTVSRDNVNLQRGHYITETQKEQMRAALKKNPIKVPQ